MFDGSSQHYIHLEVKLGFFLYQLAAEKLSAKFNYP